MENGRKFKNQQSICTHDNEPVYLVHMDLAEEGLTIQILMNTRQTKFSYMG